MEITVVCWGYIGLILLHHKDLEIRGEVVIEYAYVYLYIHTRIGSSDTCGHVWSG